MERTLWIQQGLLKIFRIAGKKENEEGVKRT
jgi:hypothetical protein